MNAKLTTALSALALGASLTVSAVAVAQTPSIVVRYSDLDVSTSAGAKTLYERIQNAAWRVCLQIVPTGIDNVRCRHTLVDAAVGDLNKPAVTAVASGRKVSNLSAAR